jgi:hypothetical protein
MRKLVRGKIEQKESEIDENSRKFVNDVLINSIRDSTNKLFEVISIPNLKKYFDELWGNTFGKN